MPTVTKPLSRNAVTDLRKKLRREGSLLSIEAYDALGRLLRERDALIENDARQFKALMLEAAAAKDWRAKADRLNKRIARMKRLAGKSLRAT